MCEWPSDKMSDRRAIDEHLRDSTAVLCDILGSPRFAAASDTAAVAADTSAIAPVVTTITSASASTVTDAAVAENSRFACSAKKHPSGERGPNAVVCHRCDKVYSSESSLVQHERYQHRYSHRCAACYRSFPGESALEIHLLDCGFGGRSCEHCGKLFGTRVSLANHVRYKHPPDTSAHCPHCRRAFKSALHLRRHVGVVHAGGVGDVECTQCGKVFGSARALAGHVRYAHASGVARCRDCYRVFGSERGLERHMRQLHAADSPRCSLCVKPFKSALSLRNHVRWAHCRIQREPCPEDFIDLTQ